ncbi:hypothetical protein FACS189494_07960 [Spirochaetia bacterium]|nr:hypothetical protein FACS189494_07960 [Spirochaetia bacterium]
MKRITEDCMKKLLVGITALVLALAFASCAGMVIVDETLPPEQTASVRFAVKVLSYNGAPVNKEWRVVKIPEGNAEFLASMKYVVDSYQTRTTYSLNNVPFSYRFEGGKTYTLLSDRSKHGDWQIKIYSGDYPAASTFLGRPSETYLLHTIDVTPEPPKRGVMTSGSN